MTSRCKQRYIHGAFSAYQKKPSENLAVNSTFRGTISSDHENEQDFIAAMSCSVPGSHTSAPIESERMASVSSDEWELVGEKKVYLELQGVVDFPADTPVDRFEFINADSQKPLFKVGIVLVTGCSALTADYFRTQTTVLFSAPFYRRRLTTEVSLSSAWKPLRRNPISILSAQCLRYPNLTLPLLPEFPDRGLRLCRALRRCCGDTHGFSHRKLPCDRA